MGTSAALFNAVQNEFSSPVITELISKLLADITDIQGTDMSVPLVANYPNSFYQFQPEGEWTFHRWSLSETRGRS